jgi:probable phosphoglycerate mutase
VIAAHPGRRVAVVCHGGVINAWLSHLLELERLFLFEPLYAGVSRFLAARSGERSVRSLNEASHLREPL